MVRGYILIYGRNCCELNLNRGHTTLLRIRTMQVQIMRDNPDFNIQFVGLIEGYPCLYDRYQSDYSNRAKQDRAWEDLSRKVGGTG